MNTQLGTGEKSYPILLMFPFSSAAMGHGITIVYGDAETGDSVDIYASVTLGASVDCGIDKGMDKVRIIPEGPSLIVFQTREVIEKFGLFFRRKVVKQVKEVKEILLRADAQNLLQFRGL